MNVIIGLAYLLEKSSLDPEANGLARKITTADRSLLIIINAILDFSKIEAGRIELEEVLFSTGHSARQSRHYHECERQRQGQ